MSTTSKDYSENPEGLKLWLESNRQNGFMDLPHAHRNFVLEYLQSYDRMSAADSAGIPKGRSIHVLRDPLVQEFIKYLTEKKEHYSLITASFIEVQQLNLLGKLLGEEEVKMVDKDGCAFEAKKFHAGESVALLRDMAKSSGLVDDSVKVRVNNLNLNNAMELTEEQKQLLDQVLDGKF